MEPKTSERYIETIGRRKTASARVRLVSFGKHSVTVNEIDVESYFKTPEQRRIALESLHKGKPGGKFKITARVTGGGLSSQAEAVRHGIARALVTYDTEIRKKLKKAGFLKRDPRAKERRKFGKKGKARKSPKWSKR
jgi:small subunit ribosomal protein S9